MADNGRRIFSVCEYDEHCCHLNLISLLPNRLHSCSRTRGESGGGGTTWPSISLVCVVPSRFRIRTRILHLRNGAKYVLQHGNGTGLAAETQT